MITGAIKNKVDKIWTDIWAGGITNPLTVIEQLTYLMFIRSLDEKELETEEFENMTGEKMDKIFPQSAVGQSMRWSKFKNNDPRDIFDVISQRVFPAIKNMKHSRLPDFTELGELVEIADDSVSDVQNETAFARYMSDAMFLIPTPQVLQKIITGLDDLYEHDIADLDMQLAFLCHELETKFPNVLEKLKNASSVREASDYVLFHFEAPADQGESVQAQRAAYGAGYYSRCASVPAED